MSDYSNYGKSEWAKSIANDLDGVAFDVGLTKTHTKKARGVAVNINVMHEDEAQQLCIIQVRQCVFHERRYNEVHKNYYLCGRNENGNVFAHPVPHGIARSKTPFIAATTFIFRCTPGVVKKIIRQGDVAFVPLKKSEIPTDLEFFPAKVAANATNAKHHLVEGAYISESHPHTLYARNATLIHQKGQHPAVSVNSGKWYRVVVGQRDSEWDFSTATVD